MAPVTHASMPAGAPRRVHPRFAAALYAAVVAAALLAIGPAGSAPAALPPLPKGWGWMLAAGTVSALDANAGTATLTVAGQGRAATFEGGTQWRKQAVAGSHVVHLLPSTVIADSGNQPVTAAALRPGMPATVWAVVRPDASVLGLKLRLGPVAGTQSVRPTAAWVPGGVSGAVMHATPNMLELLTAQGTVRKVIVTGATAFRNAAGVVVRSLALAPHDVVRVEGSVNSDGSVAATRIDLEMDAAAAAQVSGPIDQVFQEIEGLMIGGVAVALAPGVYYFRTSEPGLFKQLVPGLSAVAYGAPIIQGSTLVGLRARVVAMR